MSSDALQLMGSTVYKAAVIGAGPAGLALVATLLDTGAFPIIWVDPTFDGGRLAHYVEVPSNTKVKLFTQYAMTSPSLAAVSADALAPFKAMDPEKGCDLGYARSMVATLSAAVRSEYKDKVHCHEGTITSVVHQADGMWSLDGLAHSETVYMATGAHPRPSVPDTTPLDPAAGPGPRTLDLDDMLMPSRIPSLVSSEDVVAVVGSSHSAVLVLRNLIELGAGKAPKVVNLYRSPLLYAQFMEGWILYDNTGLKGQAAEWAHEHLDTKAYELTGALERVCVKNDTAIAAATLARCTAVVYAVGFDRNDPPAVFAAADGEALPKLQYDALTGDITGAPGVRGFGIAFPERVTDPQGHVEHAVGLWKFMRYIRAMVVPPAAAEPAPLAA